ncbi:MAG: hypothetical protein WC284_15525, partial [Candidimonas sp.]
KTDRDVIDYMDAKTALLVYWINLIHLNEKNFTLIVKDDNACLVGSKVIAGIDAIIDHARQYELKPLIAIDFHDDDIQDDLMGLIATDLNIGVLEMSMIGYTIEISLWHQAYDEEFADTRKYQNLCPFACIASYMGENEFFDVPKLSKVTNEIIIDEKIKNLLIGGV